jgi:predicted small lipoprotein YifL
MRNQIKHMLLVLLVMTLTACGRMGDLVPINESQVASVESTSISYS